MTFSLMHLTCVRVNLFYYILYFIFLRRPQRLGHPASLPDTRLIAWRPALSARELLQFLLWSTIMQEWAESVLEAWLEEGAVE